MNSHADIRAGSPRHHPHPIARGLAWLLWRVAVAVAAVTLIMFGDTLVLWLFRDELAARAALELERRLPGWDVQIRSLQRVEGYGVVLRGVSVSDPAAAAGAGKLLEADEVAVRCATSLESLLAGHAHPSQIVLRRPRITAPRMADLARRFTGSAADLAWWEHLPEVRIVDGVARIGDPQLGELLLQEIQGALFSRRETEDGEVRSRMLLQCRGETVGAARLQASLTPATGAWEAHAKLRQVELGERFVHWILRQADPAAAEWRATGVVSCDVSIAQAAWSSRPRFRMEGRLHQGTATAPNAALVWRGVTAAFQLDQDQWRVTSCAGRCDAAQVSLTASQQGWAADAPVQVDLQARQFTLTRPMIDLLPEATQEDWRQSRPLGLMDFQVRVRRRQGEWTTSALVHCRDVTARHVELPYTFRGLHGVANFTPESLTLDLQSLVDGEVVKITGDLSRVAGGEVAGWTELQCDGWVALNEELVQVLPQEQQDLLTALQASGKIRGHARIERLAGGRVGNHIEVEVRGATARYLHFPYPIADIHGKLIIDNERCVIQRLQGRKGSASIVCTGLWDGEAQDGRKLKLTFDCREIPLDDQLHQSLGAHGQAIWKETRPAGVLDQLVVQVEHDPARQETSWDVSGVQAPRESNLDGRALSLFIRSFPYALQNLSGRFVYRDGTLSFQDLRARHDEASLQARGSWFSDAERWRLVLDRLIVEELTPRRELIAATPPTLAAVVEKLRGGKYALDGRVVLEGGCGAAADVEATWDLTADLENASLACGTPLESIRGSVKLAGSSDGSSYRNRGDLQIDSMMLHGVQLTGVRGVFWNTPRQTVLGSPPGPQRDIAPLEVAGRMLGGEVAFRGVMVHEPDSPFVLYTRVEDVQLRQAAAMFSPANRQVSGQLSGEVYLQGNSHGRHTWVGGGEAHLRQAELYETPFMIKLLTLLSIRPPDSQAFSTADATLRIEGEQVYLDSIQLSGESLTLRGSGEVNAEKDVRANLYAAVRGAGDSRLAGKVFRAASRQLLQIDVEGKTDDPQITRRPLPELNDAIQRLFPELARQPERSGAPLQRLTDAVAPWRR